MNRTSLLAGTVCAAAFGHGAAAQTADSRPNIIFIMSDDHASQAISAYGGLLANVLPTPNIDRLAREGALLENCFVTNSISTPSRAAILTGQYSQCNGVYTLSDKLDPRSPNMAKELQAAGYATAVIGKWHLHSEPSGFDYYNIFPGQGSYYNPGMIEKGKWRKDQPEGGKGVRHEGHSTDIVATEALEWLEGRQQDKPFMLMCHFKAPHRPWQPAERFATLLADDVIPEPPNLLDTYEGKGEWVNRIRMSLEDMNRRDLKTEPRKDLARDDFRRWAYQIYIKDYLRCVAGVDENVGRLLDYLDEKGLAENTIVIYTSDQGFFLGEHGWFDKRLMFEESLRMPFLIRYPGRIKPGTVNSDIVANIDFAPMMLDYAGVETPSYMQGRSFRQNLEGNTPKTWRKAMYYRYWMHADGAHNTTAHYGIRTDRYKLIFFYARSLRSNKKAEEDLTPVWELYDLRSDPAEMNNIYNDPRNRKLIQKLKRELTELKELYGDEDSAYPQMQALHEK